MSSNTEEEPPDPHGPTGQPLEEVVRVQIPDLREGLSERDPDSLHLGFQSRRRLPLVNAVVT